MQYARIVRVIEIASLTNSLLRVNELLQPATRPEVVEALKG